MTEPRARQDANRETDKGDLTVSLHGPGASIEGAIEAGTAMKKLLEEVAREMGVEGAEWRIASVYFKCDGCGLSRPDRPGPDEGWTYSDGDDFCPACTESSLPVVPDRASTR